MIRVGDRFGRLTTQLETRLPIPPKGKKTGNKAWMCRCDCGTELMVRLYSLTNGNTISCGCAKRERAASGSMTRTHGMTHSRTFVTWRSMIARCYNPKQNRYQYYGGRGISVCDRWKNSFEAFLADLGPRPQGMTIDRKNSSNNYALGNCRWATAKEQANNRRPYPKARKSCHR